MQSIAQSRFKFLSSIYHNINPLTMFDILLVSHSQVSSILNDSLDVTAGL